MRTWTEEELERLDQYDDLVLLKKVKYFVEERQFESCHEAAGEVAQNFGLTPVRGVWLCGFEHSWCLTKHGNVIDPYPVGTVGGPLLVTKELVSDWMYVPDGKRARSLMI